MNNNSSKAEALELNSSNFIKNIIEEDLKSGKHTQIITRFPPEPNGYLHVGHCKSLCLNFGLAEEFNGKCNLRFDDTNPEKESEEYVQSIINDIKWLGFKWDDDVKYASDYFDKCYEFAVHFIKKGLAYVCDLTFEELRKYRGTLVESGINSPYRDRNIEENLELFEQMRDGKFEDGSKTLRLKIDMSSPNINLRDPVIYRIKHTDHIKTLDKWCIYPMYDYTHCISDALEYITHSCCTLEFEDHRPLYDWVVERLVKDGLLDCHPRQIEFSRLELQYSVTSKRKLNQLIVDGFVSGWDDPRMPTISGMRRRGYTPDGLKLFAKRSGISKSPNVVDFSLLENSIRDELESSTPRIMAVLNPLKVIIENFDEIIDKGRTAAYHPNNINFGERKVDLEREIWIEKDDFMEEATDLWQRLSLNKEVRLRHSYIIKCNKVIKDDKGEIVELHCSVDLDTLGKNPVNRKVKGVIHWVGSQDSIKAEVRIYDKLFTDPWPDKVEGRDFKEFLNTNSLSLNLAFVEPAILTLAKTHTHFQFERLGYFTLDNKDTELSSNKLVFNKTVGLKDNWKK